MERLISYINFKDGFSNQLIDKAGAEDIKNRLVREGFTRAKSFSVDDILTTVNQEILMGYNQVVLPGEDKPVSRYHVMTERQMADVIRMALNWEDVDDLVEYFKFWYDVETLEEVEDIVDDILYS